MLRKLAALSILAIAGTLAFSATAKAQIVPFEGTLAKQCTFGTSSTGTLNFPNNLSFTSNNASGAPGRVDVTCNSPAILSVTNISQTAGTTTSFTLNASAAVSSGTATNVSSSSAATTSLGVGTETVIVHMDGTSPSIITADTYNFNVTLVATPN